jgi:hypothetical protein
MKTKDIAFRIAEKLDQRERGYPIPKIIYDDDDATDTQHQLIVEYGDTDKFLITIEKLSN